MIRTPAALLRARRIIPGRRVGAADPVRRRGFAASAMQK